MNYKWKRSCIYCVKRLRIAFEPTSRPRGGDGHKILATDQSKQATVTKGANASRLDSKER